MSEQIEKYGPEYAGQFTRAKEDSEERELKFMAQVGAQNLRVIRHEGAHQLFHLFGITPLEVYAGGWLIEGLAVYCETEPIGQVHVEDDDHGKEDLLSLEKNGVSTDFVKTHAGMKSNYHYVLWYEDERTILVKHEEYPYSLPDLGTPGWIYLSSLGENSLSFHHEISSYLTKNPETKLAFQPGTFQIKLGYEALSDIYKLSELFFCNVQEAQRILKTKETDIKKLLESVCELGPKISIITDGPRGAYTYDRKEFWHMPMYPDPAPPVDRTGAGDSFASTFTSALALGKPIPEALSWGPINSMSVVQHVGAQEGLLSRKDLEKFLSEAPSDYKPERL